MDRRNTSSLIFLYAKFIKRMCRGTKNAETHLFGPVPAFLSFILYYFVFYTILFIFVHL